MFAFPLLLVQAAWCAAVVLTLGSYRTISLNTLACYAALGLLGGVVVLPVVEQALLPLRQSALGTLVVVAVQQVLLLAPLLPFFRRAGGSILAAAEERQQRGE